MMDSRALNCLCTLIYSYSFAMKNYGFESKKCAIWIEALQANETESEKHKWLLNINWRKAPTSREDELGESFNFRNCNRSATVIAPTLFPKNKVLIEQKTRLLQMDYFALFIVGREIKIYKRYFKETAKNTIVFRTQKNQVGRMQFC